MTDKETIQILTLVTAAYPQSEIPKPTLALFAESLKDLSFEQAQAAVQLHISKSKWFPTIAELRQAAIQMMPGAQRPLPDEAWGEVMEQIRKEGHYGTPQFSCQEIEKAVKAVGGWRYLCLSENTMSDRAHFVNVYETFVERHYTDMKMLPTARELQRKLLGTAAPRLVGGEGS